MQHPYKSVTEFHEAFGVMINAKPVLPDADTRTLRKNLLAEEYKEYTDAEAEDDLVEIADALADIIYIAYGTAVAYGIPLDKVFAEVHASNMNKLGPDGKPIYRADGKVIKPAGWTPPDVAGILESHSN